MFQQAVLSIICNFLSHLQEQYGKDIQQAVHYVLCNPKYPLPDTLFYYKDIRQAVLHFQHLQS